MDLSSLFLRSLAAGVRRRACVSRRGGGDVLSPPKNVEWLVGVRRLRCVGAAARLHAGAAGSTSAAIRCPGRARAAGILSVGDSTRADNGYS